MKRLMGIKLTNFQSHKDTTIEFAPGLNVIIGTTDSGKSAILRAIQWVTTNRPAGDWMIAHWASECAVEVITDETTVVRNKGKESSYTVSSIKYSAFGQSIPDQVLEALPFQESNIAEQLDAPYLISLPESQVAQFFNKIIGLGQIDTTVSEVNNRIRTVSSKLKQAMEGKAKMEKKLVDLDKMHKMEQSVREWEQGMTAQVNKGAEILELSTLISRAKSKPSMPFDIEEAIASVKADMNKGKELGMLEKAIQRANRAASQTKVAKEQLDTFLKNTPMCDDCGRPLDE